MRGMFLRGLLVAATIFCAAGCMRGTRSPAVAGRGGPVNEPAAPIKVNTATVGPLSFTKWRLGNGLEILLAPDPSARSVCYMTWYRVGSRHENAAAGETGLAHLFEHLMFTQTTGAKSEGEFDRKMESVGANVNAMTDHDYTAYVNNLPPGQFALAAELESDRMVNLALTNQQVETEREVVAEERLMAVEDDVDGHLDELLFKTAFRKHPYHWPVIGWMKDIKAVTREKAVRFYRQHYAPNNAVVIVTGQFEEEQALEILRQRYGALPPSQIDAPANVDELAPVEAARIEEPHPVPADRVAIAFAAPPLGHPDRAAFDILDEILAGSPSARLHREMVIEKELASSVGGSVAETRDPGLYILWIQMRKGHHAAEAEAIVARVMSEITAAPLQVAELEAARNRLQTQFWGGLTSSAGRAMNLGLFEVAAGDYRTLFKRAEEHAAVSPADVQRVAGVYLQKRPHLVAVAVPGEPQ